MYKRTIILELSIESKKMGSVWVSRLKQKSCCVRFWSWRTKKKPFFSGGKLQAAIGMSHQSKEDSCQNNRNKAQIQSDNKRWVFCIYSMTQMQNLFHFFKLNQFFFIYFQKSNFFFFFFEKLQKKITKKNDKKNKLIIKEVFSVLPSFFKNIN